jgi:hypothetical protein
MALPRSLDLQALNFDPFAAAALLTARRKISNGRSQVDVLSSRTQG